jgi:hypothetical protein
MTYEIWPGIGLSETPVDWTKAFGPASSSAKSTANVERRRSEGSDFSTFKGISHKSDELSRRGAPSTMRKSHVATGGKIGKPIGTYLCADSNCGMIRAALSAGPLTRAQLRSASGVPGSVLDGYLKNDLNKGRIVKINREGAPYQFALAEVA